jgi:hypothetical protein
MQAIFPKKMFGLKVSWIHFHKTTPIHPKRVLVMGFNNKGHAIVDK